MTESTLLRPRKQPRQARSRELVERVLVASARVFAEEGYAAATTNRIAEQAGVSVGSLYQFFPHKAALLQALRERIMTQMQQGLSVVFLSSDELSLPQLIDRVFAVFQAAETERPGMLSVVYQEQSARQMRPGQGHTQGVQTELFGTIEVWLARYLARQAPALSPERRRVVAQMCVHLTSGLFLAPPDGRPLFEAEVRAALLAYLLPLFGEATP